MNDHQDQDHDDKRPSLGAALLDSLIGPRRPAEVTVAEDRSDAGAGIIHPTGADDDKPSDRRPTATPTSIDTAGPSGLPADPLNVKVREVVRVKPEGHVPTREVPPETWTLRVIGLTADRPVMIAPANPERVRLLIASLDSATGVAILLAPDPEPLTYTPPGTYWPLVAGQTLELHHTAAVYARTYTGTCDVAVSTELRESERT